MTWLASANRIGAGTEGLGGEQAPVAKECALDETARRHPGTPVVLLGHSMGGRAALHAAGHPAVHAVCALAPWLDGTDPVAQLAGRTVLIAHGDQDRMTDPAESYLFAVRARQVTDRVCRFDVHGEGHAMLTGPGLALARAPLRARRDRDRTAGPQGDERSATTGPRRPTGRPSWSTAMSDEH